MLTFKLNFAREKRWLLELVPSDMVRQSFMWRCSWARPEDAVVIQPWVMRRTNHNITFRRNDDIQEGQ